MLSRLFKPLALPPQLQWEYEHEPALEEWTIRVRNYNTFVANGLFVFMLLMDLIATYTVHAGRVPNHSDVEHMTVSVGFFLLMALTIACMTHQRVNFAFRLTQTGVEYCKWKGFPKWVLTFTKWFAGVSAAICISLASIDPSFLIGALIGPGGMGLVYFAMVNSKGFHALHTQYHHHSVKWTEVTQLAIASNREVVDLQYCMPQKDSPYMLYWNLNIFCKRKEKAKVAALIKPYLLPDIPCIVTKVNVPLSTD